MHYSFPVKVQKSHIIVIISNIQSVYYQSLSYLVTNTILLVPGSLDSVWPINKDHTSSSVHSRSSAYSSYRSRLLHRKADWTNKILDCSVSDVCTFRLIHWSQACVVLIGHSHLSNEWQETRLVYFFMSTQAPAVLIQLSITCRLLLLLQISAPTQNMYVCMQRERQRQTDRQTEKERAGRSVRIKGRCKEGSKRKREREEKENRFLKL